MGRCNHKLKVDRYSLMAPRVKPRIRYRWVPHAIRITGVTNMAPSADIWPHSSDLSVIKPAMTTGIVSALNEVRIKANRNSFHARITENSGVANRTGTERGRGVGR